MTYALAESFNEEVQFDLLFYRFLLQPTLGGEKGIPIVHFFDCCIRWSATSMFPSRGTIDLLNCIFNNWVNVFGGPKTLTLDWESGMCGEDVGNLAIYNQTTLKIQGISPKGLAC